ncbi:MAG: potassium channel protein [Myxococcales bacterium]|nr:potassium channel protein [Myxococcales bacterium]
MHSVRLLRWVAFGLLLVLTYGTAGYMSLAGADFVNALYMTVTSITTVGFGEIIPLDRTGRIFTMSVIFFGVVLIMMAIGVLTQIAVEGTLRRVLEKRRMTKQIHRMQNHYVLCGCGRIGKYILEELRKVEAPVVVIEQNLEVADQLNRDGVLCIHGNATEEETLEKTNLEQARGLVVAIGSDAEAVFIILTARDHNPDLFIVARALEEKNELKLRRAGANRVLSPYRFIGKRMASSILSPAIIDMLDSIMYSGELDLAMEGLLVYSSSPVAGKSLRDSGIREKLGLMIIGIRKAHGNIHFNPTADEVIEPGDTLISIGEKDSLRKLTDFLSGGIREL